MRKAIILVVHIMVLTLLLPPSLLPSAKAFEDVTLLPADTMRIPSALTLLEQTPFYDNAGDNQEPAGYLAPQEVKVLAAESNWTVGFAWWRIETWLGEKYIHPKPWKIQVAPPSVIALFEETPIYAEPDDTLEPTARLAPQEVQTLEGESQWFMPNWDGTLESLKWIKIRTSWVGDQWIHVPRYRIGHVQKANYRVYYSFALVRDKPSLGPYDWEISGHTWTTTNSYYQVVGEYKSPFTTQYVVETEKGPRFINEQGYRIRPVSQELKLAGTAILFDRPSSDGGTLARLKTQSVQVDSIIDHGPLDGIWYHVLSDQGDGWLSTSYMDPADAKPTTDRIRIINPKILYPYPNRYSNSLLDKLPPQNLNPLSYWEEKRDTSVCYREACHYRTRWYQVESTAGKAWAPLEPWNGDRLMPQGYDDALQILSHVRGFENLRVEGSEISNVDGEVIGFLEKSIPYVAVERLAKMFRYSYEESKDEGILLSSGSDYSLRLDGDSDEALLLWKQEPSEKVSLVDGMLYREGQWYLGVHDIQSLFGVYTRITDDLGSQALQLTTLTFSVEAAQGGIPARNAVIYSDFPLDPYNLVPELCAYDASGKLIAKSSWQYHSQTLGNQVIYTLSMLGNFPSEWKTGKLVLKLGERILWSMDYTAE